MNEEDFSKHVVREDLLQALKNLTKTTDLDILEVVEIKRATTGFEGFLSLVLRVKVAFLYRGDETRHTAVFVVKCMPSEGIQSEIVKSTEVFPREGLYFDKVTPLLKRVSAGKIEVPLPVCYHSVYGGDKDVIYMEDLAASGHKTPDPTYRYDGLDFEHCSLAMKSYGKLHALTVAAERLLPGDERTWIEAFPELKRDTLFYEPEPGGPPVALMGLMQQVIETTLEFSRKMDGLPKEAEASGKLRTVLQRNWHFLCKLVKQDPRGRNILGHGDCWMHNLVYTNDLVGEGKKKPVGLKFIDFQSARYSNPSIDLLDFLYNNTRKSFRDGHMDELLTIYYDSLSDNLNILGISAPPFSADELRSDFYGVYMPFGLYSEILLGPIMLLGEELTPAKAEDMTPDKFEELVTTGNSTAIRRRFDSDPHYRSLVEGFITDFVNAVFPNGLDSPESPIFSV